MGIIVIELKQKVNDDIALQTSINEELEDRGESTVPVAASTHAIEPTTPSDDRNHWVGMQYLGSRKAQNLGGDDTTPYTITNWYPLGYPTSLTSFPGNDRMVMLVSITDESTIFQGLRNIDPFSTYYAICQDPAYISYL